MLYNAAIQATISGTLLGLETRRIRTISDAICNRTVGRTDPDQRFPHRDNARELARPEQTSRFTPLSSDDNTAGQDGLQRLRFVGVLAPAAVFELQFVRETLRVHPHCTATLEEQLNWQRPVFELALCEKNRAPLVCAAEIAGIQPRPALRCERRASTLASAGESLPV